MILNTLTDREMWNCHVPSEHEYVRFLVIALLYCFYFPCTDEQRETLEIN